MLITTKQSSTSVLLLIVVLTHSGDSYEEIKPSISGEDEKAAVSEEDTRPNVSDELEMSAISRKETNLLDSDENIKLATSNEDNKPAFPDKHMMSVISHEDMKLLDSDTGTKAVVSDEDEKLAISDKDTNSGVSYGDKKPVDSDENIKPVVANNDDKATIPNKDTNLAVSHEDTKSVGSTEGIKLAVSNEDEKPAVPDKDTISALSHEDTKPVDTNEDIKPDVSNEDEKIVVYEDAKLVVSNDDKNPAEADEDKKRVLFEEDRSEICLTSSCIHTASAMLRYLDTTVDPCDDFYEFACGGWISKHPKPNSQCVYSIDDKIQENNLLLIKNILEKASNFTETENKAKLYYNACTTSESSDNSTMILLEIMNQLGVLNMQPNTNSHFNLQKMLEKAHNTYGVAAFFSWKVGENDMDFVNDNKIHLYYERIAGLTREQQVEKMTDFFNLLNVKRSHAQIKRVIQLETELVNVMTPPDDAVNKSVSVHELQALAPFLNWLDFFNDAFRMANNSITKAERVFVNDIDYFRKATHLLKQYMKNKYGENTVKSYMMWVTYLKMWQYMSVALTRKSYDYQCGTEPWRFCVSDTADKFPLVIGTLFHRNIIHSEMKSQTKVMINNILTAFKNNLRKMHWMDAEARAAAEDKADGITATFGFTDYILNPPELEPPYYDMIMLPDQYFRNNLQVILFNLKSNFAQLNKPVEKEWEQDPVTTQGTYYPNTNHFMITTGLLQLPFYDGDNAESVNYGGLGFMTGHELIHAFDTNDVHYDRNGDSNELYNEATYERFSSETECIDNQYSNFKLEGLKLNGTRTLAEDVADNGAVKVVYQAYLNQSRRADKIYNLPGLAYTHRQIFFIAFAQSWCEVLTKEEIKNYIEDDEHTVPKYRVIGPLMNLNEFSEEFQCPLGSKMNPIKKCKVF